MAKFLAALWIVLPSVAFAVSPAALEKEARALAAEFRAAASAEPAVHAELLERLADLSLRFVGTVQERLGRGADLRNASLRAAHEALSSALDGLYELYRARTEKMVAEVIEADGDLEALYETEAWRTAQELAARALYFRNWVSYYGARLYAGEKNKALLEKARAGFQEFAVGDGETPLRVESRLGRALCALELGDAGAAARDLQDVVRSSVASAEQRAKAAVALVEARLAAREFRKAAEESRRLLAEQGENFSPEQKTMLRYLRVRALLGAAGGGKPSEGVRREVVRELGWLRARGGAWEKRVQGLIAEMKDPSAWFGESGDPFLLWTTAQKLVEEASWERARTVLERYLRKPESVERKLEATYLLGYVEFRLGRYPEAAARFETYLAEGGEREAAAARYLAFKAWEQAAAATPAPENAEHLYRAALRYVEADPRHPKAFEAYYRLGELEQARGRFAEAEAWYERVSGDPAFERRALFGRLQCKFERWRSREGTRLEREKRLSEIGDLVARLERELQGGAEDDAELHEIRGKFLPLAAAYYRAVGKEEDALRVLDGYERRFPEREDLLPAVVRLRLEALAELGRFSEARTWLEKPSAAFWKQVEPELLESLAERFRRAANRFRGPDARTAREIALHLLGVAERAGAQDEIAFRRAELYEENGQWQEAAQLYRRLGDHPRLGRRALAGLGRVLERSGDFEGAETAWRALAERSSPGDAVWYEARYEVARLLVARNKADEACKFLRDLRPAWVGLGNPELRRKFEELRSSACGRARVDNGRLVSLSSASSVRRCGGSAAYWRSRRGSSFWARSPRLSTRRPYARGRFPSPSSSARPWAVRSGLRSGSSTSRCWWTRLRPSCEDTPSGAPRRPFGHEPSSSVFDTASRSVPFVSRVDLSPGLDWAGMSWPFRTCRRGRRPSSWWTSNSRDTAGQETVGSKKEPCFFRLTRTGIRHLRS
ncbi:MAG: hypothetical protein KatS3mg076_1274 [Candidatus Binatia bacterium]|nr:MAG: hypothetical protein KatS3mg076_1274 [Candidatus Binatia bacterium]